MAETADLLAGFATHLCHLRERAGGPSYEVLARLTAGTRWPQTRSTIYDKLSGKSVPSEEFVRAFVSACLVHARRSGRELDSQDTDLEWWVRECSELRRAVAQARRDSGKKTLAASAGLRRLVRDWDPFVLGVHHAIRVGVPVSRLPEYVERPHDGELAALIAPVLESSRTASQMIVLVGGSSTGKTRTAYEAALRYLPDWSMAFPAAAEDLIALLQGGKVSRRTVVWLNEAQAYLSAPACALALRRFLAESPGQVIMLGTLWPAYRDEFTVLPAAGQPDSFRQARELLSTAAIVTVPDRFTAREIAQVRRMKDDPRLAAAVAGSGATGRVTQILAAGLDLVGRFDTADLYSRAVVVAAMDAARLGCSAPLPGGYLRQAAESYLDDEARADPPADWWPRSLEYVTAKVRQAVAMAAPVRLRPGLGDADGYRLADYLVQHGLLIRAAESVPQATWQALYETITDTGDRLALAANAEYRGYFRYACLLGRESAAAGDREAAKRLARILKRAGHHEEAGRYERAAGIPGVSHTTAAEAMRRVQAALDRAERAEADRRRGRLADLPVSVPEENSAGMQREGHLREAVRSGDPKKRVELSWLLHEQGRPDEAASLWLADAQDEDRNAMLRLASILELAGRLGEATSWAKRACTDSSSFALIKLTTLLERQGKISEAIDAWRSAAERGSPEAMRELAFLLAKTSDTRQAEQWYRHATGFGENYLWLAEFLEQHGKKSEAVQMRRFGIEPGGHAAEPW